MVLFRGRINEEFATNVKRGLGVKQISRNIGRKTMQSSKSRRDFLFTSTLVGATILLNGCGKLNREKSAQSEPNELGGEVTATEDLMREHGILRRALLVYSAAAIK